MIDTKKMRASCLAGIWPEADGIHALLDAIDALTEERDALQRDLFDVIVDGLPEGTTVHVEGRITCALAVVEAVRAAFETSLDGGHVEKMLEALEAYDAAGTRKIHVAGNPSPPRVVDLHQLAEIEQTRKS